MTLSPAGADDVIDRERAFDAGIVLSIVVPVFNEAATVALFMREVTEAFGDLAGVRDFEVIFVNDGSTDETLACVLALQHEYSTIRVIDLSRNFGKEAALSAGLISAAGDVVVPIDVDLQDPPRLVGPMLDKWREGFDVVLARRASRSSDTNMKRWSAVWFYRVHNWISEVQIPENVGDFRLMDRRVVEVINRMPESRRFMKGLFAWVGFRTCVIDYTRAARSAGLGKFNGWRLWNLALEGVTSYSTIPLRIWTYAGAAVALGAFVYALFIAANVLVHGVDVPGYASLLVAVTLLGGIQLIGIGVLGEYMGRTYLESKRRPVFVVRKIYSTKANDLNRGS